MNSIFAVVILFNPDVKVLSELVDSLLGQVDQIVLVDNCSSNVDLIKENYKKIKKVSFIGLDQNYGIAKAQNEGIKFSKNEKATQVLFFDQDSCVSEGFVDGLLLAKNALSKAGEKVAAVGPSFYDSRTGKTYPFSLIRGFSLKSIYPSSTEDPIEVSFLISSGSLVDISAIDYIGGMKEEFFIDYVDIEWGLRSASFGMKSFGIPSVKMAHSIGDNRKRFLWREISIHSPLRRYYLARNSIFMLKLPYVPFKYKVREMLYSFTRVFVFLISVENKVEYMKYILRGWRDGVQGVGGRYKKR